VTGELAVPRDRDGSFEPQIVRKRQRRLSGVDWTLRFAVWTRS
jgi:transposase-like protein